MMARAQRRQTIPISTRALVQRIRRKLANKKLLTARGYNAGRYYIIDQRTNGITAMDVDLKILANELGVIKPWENWRGV